jgi:MFS family permease
VDCHDHLWNLRGRPRYGCYLGDEHSDSVAIFDFAPVDSRFVAFLLFTLPAGALADMVDRKKLLYVVNVWLAASAAGLAILGWLNLLNSYIILAFVFLIGVGFAMNAPTWTSSVSDVVSNAELPSAAALGGLQLNISAIIGPALGGLVVAWIGPNPVFRSERRLLPGRDFGCPAMEESGRTTEDWPGELFRLFCDGYPLRPVCARTSNCFGAECVVCPVHFSHSRTDASRRPESIRSQPFTTRPFIHEHGVGSVVAAAFIIPRLRDRYSPNMLIILANLLVVLVGSVATL